MLLKIIHQTDFDLQRFDQRIDHGTAHGPAAGAGSASAVVRSGDWAADDGEQLFRLAGEYGSFVQRERVSSADFDLRDERGGDGSAAEGAGAVSRSLADSGGGV